MQTNLISNKSCILTKKHLSLRLRYDYEIIDNSIKDGTRMSIDYSIVKLVVVVLSAVFFPR